MDPLMPTLVGSIVAILVVGSLVRRMSQPHVIAYLAAGMVLGPQGLGILTDHATITRLGEFSFVLAAIGRQLGIITDFAYQATIG
jgi:CPA2 family monovalent cation:H+ antiporter-2